MVDECHAAGFIRATAKGTLEEKAVMGSSRYYHRNFRKGIRGAMGGYTTAKKEIIELLRQPSMSYFILQFSGSGNSRSIHKGFRFARKGYFTTR